MPILETLKTITTLAKQVNRMDLNQQVVDLTQQVMEQQQREFDQQRQITALMTEISALKDQEKLREQMQFRNNALWTANGEVRSAQDAST